MNLNPSQPHRMTHHDRTSSRAARGLALCATALLLWPARASGQAPEVPDPSGELRPPAEELGEGETGEDGEENRVSTSSQREGSPHRHRASSRVDRQTLEERQPRSAPDALRYEPGVFVQQTSHGQGSAFVRGRTGQQTVLMFDDVRMNNSLFRQGPNQYFFTVDARTIDHLDVLRGSASTRYGSDAIAGVISATPIDPTLIVGGARTLRPAVMARHATADGEWGGRLQLDAQLAPRWAVLLGGGYRDVDQLESGGPVLGPQGQEALVPRFQPDGRTQLGTGFKEAAWDARLIGQLDAKRKLTVAYYDYRQFDAPRTDQCPPPEAPFNECTTFDEQFRTLIYASLEGDWGALARASKLVLSTQRQHERRSSGRPLSFTLNGGRDDVESWGALWRAETASAPLGAWGVLKARYGADLYRDRVSSAAWVIFTDNDLTLLRSRGQYIEGSSYTTLGAWSELAIQLGAQVEVRAGGRVGSVDATSPRDEESGTRAINRQWGVRVANLGAQWWANRWLTVMASVDQGFRAPNLDDLTSRQRTGPGFQLENAALEPERGVTSELGARVETRWLELDAWLYHSALDQAIERAQRQVTDCPPNTPACNSSRTYLQLVNTPGRAVIWGADGGAKLRLPGNVRLGATLSLARGDAPSTQPGRADERVPLTRMPPLNGTVEALWRGPKGLYVGGAMRWARAQTRLSLSDVSDARIPPGGTPGFALWELRAGYRYRDRFNANLVLENLTDQPYRYHGSSINGPGRGLTFNLSASY